MSKRDHLVAVLLATCISFPTSCVDDSYDLTKDIDMTVNVGGNLVIPTSDTEEIKLSQIMDLEDNSIIKANALNGNYMLEHRDECVSNATIDAVTLNEKETRPTVEDLDFKKVGGRFEAEVNNVNVEIYFEDNEVTDELIELDRAEVSSNSVLTLSFEGSGLSAMTLCEGFLVEFLQEDPHGIYTFDFNEGQQFLPAGTSSADYKIEGQTIHFKKDIEIRQGETLQIPLTLKSIEFPDGLPVENGTIKLVAKALGHGKAAIDAQVNDRPRLVIGGTFGDIQINSVTGIADPNIDIENQIIEVTGIPDFLTEKNTVLDFQNPVFAIEISNPTPFNLNIEADIRREKTGESAQTIHIGRDRDANQPDQQVVYHGQSGLPTTYYFSRKPIDEYNDPANRTYNRVLGDRLSQLLKTIPEEVELTDIKAHALQEIQTFELGDEGQEYTVTTVYSILTPLQFGPDVHIEYNDTISGWSEDLEDFTIKDVVVTLDAINGIPLDFDLQATAIDTEGNPCENIKVDVVKGEIAAGCKINDGSNLINDAKESSIELKLTCDSDDMSELDGIIIKFVANKKNPDYYPDAILNENMTLRLNNIRLRVRDGITFDLN